MKICRVMASCAAIVLLLVSGCATEVEGESVAGPVTSSAITLPFVPTISERSNERNSGSTFEPCVAYSDEEMRSIGADPRTMSDAAISDSPNYRGCHWETPGRVGLYSQIVGDEVSTDEYKRKQYYRQWQPDRIIGGRTVIVAIERPEGCFASFMSERAMVHSSFSSRTPSEGLRAECDIAIKWATLAIAKAP